MCVCVSKYIYIYVYLNIYIYIIYIYTYIKYIYIYHIVALSFATHRNNQAKASLHRDPLEFRDITGQGSCKAALNLVDLFTKAESARAWRVTRRGEKSQG